jgi:hypothetical protein
MICNLRLWMLGVTWPKIQESAELHQYSLQVSFSVLFLEMFVASGIKIFDGDGDFFYCVRLSNNAGWRSN